MDFSPRVIYQPLYFQKSFDVSIKASIPFRILGFPQMSVCRRWIACYPVAIYSIYNFYNFYLPVGRRFFFGHVMCQLDKVSLIRSLFPLGESHSSRWLQKLAIFSGTSLSFLHRCKQLLFLASPLKQNPCNFSYSIIL